MTHEQSKNTSKFNAAIRRGSASINGVLAHGQWLFKAHGPLTISDPDHFLRLCAAQGLLCEFATRNTIHVSTWDRIKVRLSKFEAMLSGGNLLWEDNYHNIVTNVGLDDILDKYFKGSSYTAAHYIGLASSSPTVAAGDTMSSHAGWTEVHTQYSESTRPAFTPGTVSGQSVDNSGSAAIFSITGTVTVGGGFLTTNNTKNGTTGTLYSVGAFSGGDKAVGNGDTLSVTATFTQADDGV